MILTFTEVTGTDYIQVTGDSELGSAVQAQVKEVDYIMVRDKRCITRSIAYWFLMLHLV